MLSPVVTETRIGLFLCHALVLEKMMIAFFPKRQNPRLDLLDRDEIIPRYHPCSDRL